MGNVDRNKADEPGAPSQPEDSSGDGPVTLAGRTEPGGQGSPDTNQARTEPMPPSGTHPEPLTVPQLDDMNISGADPQAPRHPAALRSDQSGTGAYAQESAGGQPAGGQPAGLGGTGATFAATRPAPDLTDSTGRAPGPEQPRQVSTGTSHRAPGMHGQTPDGEWVRSDTTAGAARMGPQALDSRAGAAPGQGDDATVPSAGTSPSPGTSEEHRIVSGIKLPEADEA
ncbi:MAG: hypothetical protein WD794_05185 [Mycobacteriales bacterium]